MRWFLDLSTRGKLYLIFGVMIALLTVVAAAAYRSVSLVQESQRALYEQEFSDVLDLKEIRGGQIANRADLLSMMVPGSRAEAATLEKAIRERVKRVDEGIRRLLTRNQADRVRALGIKMAIDDFGTGYSSHAYLAKLPVETGQDRPFLHHHRAERPRHRDQMQGYLFSKPLPLAEVTALLNREKR